MKENLRLFSIKVWKEGRAIDEAMESRTKKRIEPIDKSEAWEIPAFLRKKRK